MEVKLTSSSDLEFPSTELFVDGEREKEGTLIRVNVNPLTSITYLTRMPFTINPNPDRTSSERVVIDSSLLRRSTIRLTPYHLAQILCVTEPTKHPLGFWRGGTPLKRQQEVLLDRHFTIEVSQPITGCEMHLTGEVWNETFSQVTFWGQSKSSETFLSSGSKLTVQSLPSLVIRDASQLLCFRNFLNKALVNSFRFRR